MTDPVIAYLRREEGKRLTVAIDKASGLALHFVDAFPRPMPVAPDSILMRKRDDGVWVPVRTVPS